MSYILDALKKADRERNLAKVPTLTTVHVPVYLTGPRLAVWVVAAVLLGGGVLAWFLLSSPKGSPGSPALVEAPATVAVAPPAGAGDADSALAPRELIGPPPAATMRAVPPRPDTSSRPERPKPSGSEPPANRRASRSLPLEVPQPLPPPKRPEQSDLTLVQPESPAPPAPRPESPPREEPSQVRKDAGTVAPPPASQKAPTLGDAMSRMRLDVFVYTDVEADRMAVINGRRYIKGELIDGLYLLESINPEGVVLSYRGERAVLRP